MTGTNYQKLISIFGREFDDFYTAMVSIQDTRDIDRARTASLDNIGALFDYNRIGDEPDANYRQSLKNMIALNAAVGTKPIIRQFLANYLRIDESAIVLREETPNYIIVQLDWSFEEREVEIKRFVQRFIAAGIHVEIHFGGSYWDVDDWDDAQWR